MSKPIIWAWWAWEPLYFYEFTGRFAPGLNGEDSCRLEKWWNSVHSEEVVKWAADMGVNRIVTHFQKGFGPRYEKEGMAQTAELVKLCHKHGIKVFGYLQYGSLFEKSFLEEYPEAKSWCAVDHKKEYYHWCGSKGRLMPCVESQEFLAYLKEQIKTALTGCDLDGLHFDNFYHQPCYCEKCRQAYGEKLPLPDDDDTLRRRWAEFRSRRLAERMEILSACAGSYRSDVELIWNPGAISPRNDQMLLRSTDFVKLGPRAGLLWCEGANFPRMLAEKAVHQVNYFKTGEALNFRQFPTSWIYSGVKSRLASTSEEVELSFGEAVAFHAVPGSNWLLRPTQLEQFCTGGNEAVKSFKKCCSFYRRYAELFEPSVSAAETVIEVDPAALRKDYFKYNDALLAAEQLLLENHRPFDLSFKEISKGYSHYLKVGKDIPIHAGWGEKRVTRDADPVFPPDDAVAERLLNQLPEPEIEANCNLFVSVRRLPDGREVLHLLNYAAPEKAVVKLSPKWQGARLLQPGEDEMTAAAEICVPVWCVLVK